MPTRTLRDALNDANPNHVGDGLMALPAGEAFTLLPRTEVLTATAGVALPSVPALLVLSAFDRTNGAYLTQAAPEVAAGAGQVSVLADGSISVDPACLSAEVVYVADEGTRVTEVLQVVASAATFLAGKTSAKVLSAVVLAGIALGPKGTSIRANTPAPGFVALTTNGDGIILAAADVVTGSVSVTYMARPSQSVAARLNGAVNF